MPLPLDEIEARLSRAMFHAWLKRVGWTRDEWARLYEHGMPAEWAAAIARLTDGDLTPDAWPRVLHPPKALHVRGQKSTVNSDMLTDEHRIAISKSNRTRRDVKWRECIREAGYTQNSLAATLDIDKAILSRYRRGLAQIPAARAAEVKKLTGWPADAAHWPGGIS